MSVLVDRGKKEDGVAVDELERAKSGIQVGEKPVVKASGPTLYPLQTNDEVKFRSQNPRSGQSDLPCCDWHNICLHWPRTRDSRAAGK